MCRYAMTIYKPHFACFECRKTFKRRLAADVEGTTDFTIAAKCPQCGNLMADMGLDFESPQMNDLKAWKYIETLFIVGITFHSCGCAGPGYIPRTQENLLKYLERKKADFISNLQFWLRRIEPTGKKEFARDQKINYLPHSGIPQKLKGKKGRISNDEAIEFRNQKIKDIDHKINQLKNLESQKI
jgi:hypothetical protein